MQLECVYHFKESNIEVFTINALSKDTCRSDVVKSEENKKFTIELPNHKVNEKKSTVKKENAEIHLPKHLDIPFSKLTSIVLTHSGLDYIPYCSYFDNLLEVDISHNKFVRVPYWITDKDLKVHTLNISHNCIVLLKEVPKCSKHLIYLNISNNCIKELPFWLFGKSCPFLETLNISNNNFKYKMQHLTGRFLQKLKTLNVQSCCINLDQATYIEEIPNLKHIFLGNELTSPPQNVIHEFAFKNLKSKYNIVELDISGANISHLSEDIHNLRSLEILRVSYNVLHWLPESMKQLKRLRILDISNNSITQLPNWISTFDELTELYASYNIIGKIPESLLSLRKIQVLDFYHNDLLNEDGQFLQNFTKLTAIDVEQNYFECKDDEDYKNKRQILRDMFSEKRLNGQRELPEEIDSISDNSDLSSISWEENYQNDDVLEENWDSEDSMECTSDDNLVLPPYKYLPPLNPIENITCCKIDPAFFDDALDDHT